MARKKSSKKMNKEMEVPLWFMDGFTGVLALMIYNFVLYLIKLLDIDGLIGDIENTMGYFGLNTFIDLGFNIGGMIFGILIMFLFSYVLGIGISSWVRKKNKGRII